ncbi:O-antigen ligase family protein [Acidobacteria bacterium AH-259-G07]|nr:O-antigen ligase family protein [Acidobacteria bacterium AH-259-G07]
MAGTSATSSARTFARSDLSYLGLLVLIVAAPFERLKPVLSVLGLELTTLELVLSAALLLWLILAVIGRRQLSFKSPISWPSLLLLVVMLLSSGIAATHPGEAFRLCGRFAAGISVYFLVFNEIKSHGRMLAIFPAVVFAGTLVAVLGILEYLRAAWVLEWLAAFKTHPVYLGGQLRASSTLQYPTITSMYLEITFGLGMGLLLFLLARSRVRLTTLVFLCLLLIGEGIIITQTRGGVLIIIIQLIAIGGLYAVKRGLDRGFWVLVALALSVAGLVGHMLVHNHLYWLRLTTSTQEGWYRAQFKAPPFIELAPGELKQVEITVTNAGRVPWHIDGESPFHVSYHWLHPEENVALVFEGLRTAFSHQVQPGERIKVQARVLAPPQPGRYRLAWDLVQENRLWFSTEEPLEAYSEATIDGPPAKGELQPVPLPGLRFRVGRMTLWSTAARMLWSHPLLGVGPDNFRFLYGRYLDLETWDYSLHSNNMYLQFFVGTGILGGILFLWLCIRILGTLKQAWQQVEDRDFPFFLGVAAAVLATAVHGLFDYFLGFTSTYIMIWITWGAAGALFSYLKQE